MFAIELAAGRTPRFGLSVRNCTYGSGVHNRYAGISPYSLLTWKSPGR